MNKIAFTLDTNILLHDYRAMEALDVNIRIPLTVIREAENHKSDAGEVGWNARKSLRLIDDAMSNGDKLPNGRRLLLDLQGEDRLDPEINDHKIIMAAIKSQSKLITNDVAMRIIARFHSLDCEGYAGDEAEINKIGQVETLESNSATINMLYENKSVPLEVVKSENMAVNACLVLKEGDQKSVLARRFPDRIQKITPAEDIQGISPRNVGQKFYFDMLLDPLIKIVFVTGAPGSGKTLLAMAAATHLCDPGKKRFDQIICAKSMEGIGKEVGFLPGELEDKLAPVYASFNDCLRFLMPKSFKSDKDGQEDLGKIVKNMYNIKYEAILTMRGRTFANSFIIIDEAQNLSHHELKSVISRAGEGTKVIVMGDLHQIDTKNLTRYDNGLYTCQKKLYNEPMVGIISLPVSERSDIARLCPKLLFFYSPLRRGRRSNDCNKCKHAKLGKTEETTGKYSLGYF